MMYTYEIEYVNDRDQHRWLKWNCSCNSIETTLQIAKGACDRFHAKYGAITIRNEDGKFVKLHWFDKVLN